MLAVLVKMAPYERETQIHSPPEHFDSEPGQSSACLSSSIHIHGSFIVISPIN